MSVYDPKRSQTQVFDPIPPGDGYFIFPKMAPGPGPNAGVGALGPIWGGTLGALGPIWGGSSGRPKADIMEAEGRLNGSLGGSHPEKEAP